MKKITKFCEKNIDETNKIFVNDKINLSKIKNKKKFLNLLSSGLYELSHSKVYNGKLGIGGEYHKNYYFYLKEGFNKTKNAFFCLKNSDFNEFSIKIKLNLCNYGVYFCEKDYLIILSGNGFILAKTQQNFLEKFIKNNY